MHNFMKNFFLIFVITNLIFINNSYAYFDPGSGAFIIQALIATFTVIMFYLSYPIRIIKNFFKYIKEKFTKKKNVKE
jgi:hypothetical protein